MHTGRDDLNPFKAELAQRTNPTVSPVAWPRPSTAPTCSSGVSAGVVPEEFIATMAPNGIVFALSNPDPEIHPEVAKQVRRRGGHRAQRLPQPDQQRAGVPRRLPRRAGRRCPPDHREDEGGRCRGDPSVVGDDLAPEYIVPSPLDPRVGPAVAAAVAAAVDEAGD